MCVNDFLDFTFPFVIWVGVRPGGSGGGYHVWSIKTPLNSFRTTLKNPLYSGHLSIADTFSRSRKCPL